MTCDTFQTALYIIFGIPFLAGAWKMVSWSRELTSPSFMRIEGGFHNHSDYAKFRDQDRDEYCFDGHRFLFALESTRMIYLVVAQIYLGFTLCFMFTEFSTLQTKNIQDYAANLRKKIVEQSKKFYALHRNRFDKPSKNIALVECAPVDLQDKPQICGKTTRGTEQDMDVPMEDNHEVQLSDSARNSLIIITSTLVTTTVIVYSLVVSLSAPMPVLPSNSSDPSSFSFNSYSNEYYSNIVPLHILVTVSIALLTVPFGILFVLLLYRPPIASRDALLAKVKKGVNDLSKWEMVALVVFLISLTSLICTALVSWEMIQLNKERHLESVKSTYLVCTDTLTMSHFYMLLSLVFIEMYSLQVMLLKEIIESI